MHQHLSDYDNVCQNNAFVGNGKFGRSMDKERCVAVAVRQGDRVQCDVASVGRASISKSGLDWLGLRRAGLEGPDGMTGARIGDGIEAVKCSNVEHKTILWQA